LTQCINCNGNNVLVYEQPWYNLITLVAPALVLMLIVYQIMLTLICRRLVALKLLAYGIYTTHLQGGRGLWIGTFGLLILYIGYVGQAQLTSNLTVPSINLNHGNPCHITTPYNMTVVLQTELTTTPTAGYLVQVFLLGVLPYLSTLLLVGRAFTARYTELNLSHLLKNEPVKLVAGIQYKIVAKELDHILHIKACRCGILSFTKYITLFFGWKDSDVGNRLVEVLQEEKKIIGINEKVSSIWDE